MKPINYRNLLNLIDRIKDISVNQFENNDIEWAENYNHNLMSMAGFSINKKIKLTIIRPDKSVEIKLTDFDINEIKKTIAKNPQFKQYESFWNDLKVGYDFFEKEESEVKNETEL